MKEWVEKTNAIGLKAIVGRYGGTYAHADIALEFATWINAEFKFYFIKEILIPNELSKTQTSFVYTSDIFIETLKSNNIQVSMDGKGREIDNVFMERLWRIVKY